MYDDKDEDSHINDLSKEYCQSTELPFVLRQSVAKKILSSQKFIELCQWKFLIT